MYKSILLPVDLGHDSSWRKALPTALALVRAFGAQLHVATVCPDFGMSMVSVNFPQDFERNALDAVSRSLQSFVEQHVPADIGATSHVGHGTIYSEILAIAQQAGCDLIVLGSHRPEMRDYLLGPNASRVMRHAKQSVFVVRE